MVYLNSVYDRQYYGPPQNRQQPLGCIVAPQTPRAEYCFQLIHTDYIFLSPFLFNPNFNVIEWIQ